MVSTTFRELGLSAPILRQLENLEYKIPTPIQAACIPLLLQNWRKPEPEKQPRSPCPLFNSFQNVPESRRAAG